MYNLRNIASSGILFFAYTSQLHISIKRNYFFTIFSQPYLSNGQAFGTVVIRLSVCLSSSSSVMDAS